VSVTVTFVAEAGPLFVTVSVYVTTVPCVTGFGVAILTIARSALLALATTTVELAVLVVRLGTIFVAVAVAVSVMLVPEGVPEFTCRMRVNVPTLLTASVPAAVHVIVPVPPTAGLVPQVHPAGGVIDWKVVFGGVTCVKLAPAAATAGPLLVTVWVYVTRPAGETDVGAAEFVTTRSACVAAATTSDAVALLFAGLESVIDVLTVAVSLIAVPAVAVLLTRTV
jgi:hypothetical protein